MYALFAEYGIFDMDTNCQNLLSRESIDLQFLNHSCLSISMPILISCWFTERFTVSNFHHSSNCIYLLSFIKWLRLSINICKTIRNKKKVKEESLHIPCITPFKKVFSSALIEDSVECVTPIPQTLPS